MKARRTPWWWYVIAMLVGLLAGMGISHLEETRGLGLAGIPYLASAVMVVVGFIVLYLAWQVHRYTTTDPKKRAQLKPMDSERCVNTLIVSKALAIAGALLAGWYGGQIVMLYDRFEAPFFRHIVIECIIAVIASVIDMVLGIISEGLCQLPPNMGPEHPKVVRKRREERLARFTNRASGLPIQAAGHHAGNNGADESDKWEKPCN